MAEHPDPRVDRPPASARRRWWPALLLAASCALAAPSPAGADLAGHGGAVRSVVSGTGGRTAVTGGFDNSVMAWDTATTPSAFSYAVRSIHAVAW